MRKRYLLKQLTHFIVNKQNYTHKILVGIDTSTYVHMYLYAAYVLKHIYFSTFHIDKRDLTKFSLNFTQFFNIYTCIFICDKKSN